MVPEEEEEEGEEKESKEGLETTADKKEACLRDKKLRTARKKAVVTRTEDVMRIS